MELDVGKSIKGSSNPQFNKMKCNKSLNLFEEWIYTLWIYDKKNQHSPRSQSLVGNIHIISVKACALKAKKEAAHPKKKKKGLLFWFSISHLCLCFALVLWSWNGPIREPERVWFKFERQYTERTHFWVLLIVCEQRSKSGWPLYISSKQEDKNKKGRVVLSERVEIKWVNQQCFWDLFLIHLMPLVRSGRSVLET